MRKLVSIAAVLMMAVVTLPASSAETVEESYTGACCAREGVSGEGLGLGLILFPNSEDSPYTQAGIRPIGGVDVYASTTYNNVVVTPNDATYGSDAAIGICFYHPDGDFSCDDDDYASATGCGSKTLIGAPFENDFVTTFVYTIFVDADLTTCGGSTGSVTATFF